MLKNNTAKKFTPRLLAAMPKALKILRLKGAGFIILGILTEIIYLSFYFIEPLRKYLGNQSITLSYPCSYLFLIVIELLLLALALYILSFRQIVKNNINFKKIFIFFIIFNLTMLFVWPIGSADIFSYIGWSRVLSEHHTNPYLAPYSAFEHDAFYQTINNRWLSTPTPYGPLFTTISSVLTFFAGNSLLLSLFLFKLFFVIINVLNCYLVHKTFQSTRATFLYAWNPFILYEFSINGHSDVLTIFFLLLSLYFLLGRQRKFINYLLCWAFLLLSVLIKYMTLVLLPIIFLIILFKIKQEKEKILFCLISFAVSIIILLILFLPFWTNSNMFSTVIYYIFFPINEIMPAGPAPILNIILSVLPYYLKMNYYVWADAISKSIFVVVYCIILIKLFIERNNINKKNIIKYLSLAFLTFIITFPTWVLPWYYTALIVLIIYYSAVNQYKYNKFIYGITLLGILYYIVQR